MGTQPHLLVEEGDLADIALVPGDPDRVGRIAAQCEDTDVVSDNREYTVVNAHYKGRELTICSTGIGAPSTAIAVEELAAVGVETFVRVGTCGALQADLDIGDMVVATAAAKDEGTTRRYESPTIPAVASYPIFSTLADIAHERDESVQVGPIATDDAFYAETDEYVSDWESAGLLAVEMEAAALFSLARRNGLRAGAICTVDGNLIRGTQKGDFDADEEHPEESGADEELPEKARDNVARAIKIALESATRL